VYPENSNSFYENYLEATQDPHSYLLLGLQQDRDHLLRFPTNIFPPDFPIVHTPVENEDDKVKLSYVASA
jgi:hypothetical protein